MATADSTERAGRTLLGFPLDAAILVAISGIVAQALAYAAAQGFFGVFELSPGDLGITPLSAISELTTTILLLTTFLTWLLFYLRGHRETWEYMSTHHHRPLSPKAASYVERVRQWLQRRKRVWGTFPTYVALLLLIALPSWAGRTAGEAVRDSRELSKLFPVYSDLKPSEASVRWTKAEDRPELLPFDDPAGIKLMYFGTNNGQAYFWVPDMRRVLVVPSSQVQIQILVTI